MSGQDQGLLSFLAIIAVAIGVLVAASRMRAPRRGDAIPGWGQTAGPRRRYPSRFVIGQRDARILRVMIALGLAALAGAALLAQPAGRWSWMPPAVAAALAPMVLLAVSWWIDRYRYAPVMPAMAWVAVENERSWRQIDGRPASVDPDAILRRLEGRTDPGSVTLRCSVLVRLGRIEEAEAAIAAWADDTPAGRARRVRAESRLRWVRDGIDDMRDVEAAVAAIPDAETRRDEQVWNLYERATREMASQRDGYRALAEASRLVMPLDPEASRELQRARRINAAAQRTPPIVATAIALGSIAVLGPEWGFVVGLLCTGATPWAWQWTSRWIQRREAARRAEAG
jgi:hypothetical protein